MTERLQRRDAARNRAAILRAAGEMAGRHGRAIDVRQIAARAGVGMGTLYRHFPSKDDLLDTLLDARYADWADRARQTAAEAPDAWGALVTFMTRALADQGADRAVLDALPPTPWETDAPHAACRSRIHPVVDELVARAHAAGVLREGVTADDVLGLLAALGRAAEPADPPAERLLEIVLSGLRHGGPLGVPPRS